VLLLVSAAVMFALGRTTIGWVAVAVAVVGQQLAWCFPARAARLARGVDALGQRAGRGIGTVSFTVVHVVVILPAWLVAGSDVRRRQASGWVVVAPGGTAGDGARREGSGRRALADLAGGFAFVAGALLLGAVAGPVADARGGEIVDRATATAELPAALVDQPGASQLVEEQGGAFAAREPDPLLGWRLPDRAGALVNQVDGLRASPRPPGAGERPLVVWFFGGSVTWGLGQRDAATIPSRFAARATARGRPTVAENFGVPAYLVDQSSLRFVEALEDRSRRPDLVVFLDGYNEMYGGMASTLAGVAPGDPFVAYGPSGSSGTGQPYAGPAASLEDRYAGVVAMHERARGRAQRAAEAAGVPVVFAWQANAHSGSLRPGEPSVLAELGWSDDELRDLQAVDAELRRRLPAEVLDLGDVFADEASAIYWDTVHTNEVGADLVAERLVDDLWDQLGDLQGER
jgi:lysophospholipase L1-like esterase